MKTNIIGIVVALVLAFAAAVGAWAQDEKVSEVRKVDDFSSIRITSVANVIFTQGDDCSLRLEGKEKWVKLTTTEVKNGYLVISFKKGEKSVKVCDGGCLGTSLDDGSSDHGLSACVRDFAGRRNVLGMAQVTECHESQDGDCQCMEHSDLGFHKLWIIGY